MADKLKNLNLTFVSRSAPNNGPSSSDAWNDTFFELATDLANISREWNNKLIVAFDALPKGELDSSVNVFVNGIDGKNIWVDAQIDSGDNDLTFFNSTKNRPVTIEEAFQDIYQYVDVQLENTLASVLDVASGLTTDQKNAIGANIFDNTQTSSATSLDGKSERNRLNVIQLANDMYGDTYVIGNDGNTQLTNSVFAMVDALLELHNGNWDNDIALSHDGTVTLTQAEVNASAPGNDSFSGSPNDLTEDLDQIRTTLKTAKGTTGWLVNNSTLYGSGPSTLEGLLTSTQGTSTKTATNPWGYNYSDITGLETRLDSIGTFTGQDSQLDTDPTYSSVIYVANSDSLTTAVGKLDLALDSLSTTVDSQADNIDDVALFVGQYAAGDTSPTYSSVNYVVNGESLVESISKLDEAIATFSSSGSDVVISPAAAGLVLTAPDLTQWKVQIDTAGNLVTNNTFTPDGGDITIPDADAGVIFISPNLTNYKLQIDNSGNLMVSSPFVSNPEDVEISNFAFGLILTDPGQDTWRIQVDDSGNLTTEQATPNIASDEIDHGSLNGLLDDDHPQYLKTDGSRIAENGILSAQDIGVNDSDYGIVLKSPNGTAWRIQVDNNGQLVTTTTSGEIFLIGV